MESAQSATQLALTASRHPEPLASALLTRLWAVVSRVAQPAPLFLIRLAQLAWKATLLTQQLAFAAVSMFASKILAPQPVEKETTSTTSLKSAPLVLLRSTVPRTALTTSPKEEFTPYLVPKVSKLAMASASPRAIAPKAKL